MSMEVVLLNALGLGRLDSEQALDVGAHALVDQREQPGGCGIQAIVEVEDQGVDGHKGRRKAEGRSRNGHRLTPLDRFPLSA